MSDKRRARSDEAKAQKRDGIIAAARSLFEKKDFASITVDAVAAEAGVAKGTVFVYFSTREELFLALARELFAGFFADLLQRISCAKDSKPASLKKNINASLRANGTLLRMLPLLNVLIEKNVSDEALKNFKFFLLEGLARLGGAAEAKFSFLSKAGGGARFFLWIYGIIIGFLNLSQPAQNVKRIIDKESMDPFRFDFDGELDRFLDLFLKGIVDG